MTVDKMDNPDRFPNDEEALATLDNCISGTKLVLMRLLSVRDDWHNESKWRQRSFNMHDAHCTDTNMRRDLYDLDQYFRYTP